MIPRAAAALLIGGVLSVAGEQIFAAEPSALLEFQRDVQPLLKAHCMKCHGLEDHKARLDLRTVALMRRGGESGAAISIGAAKNSLLYAKIADRSMPPKDELPLTSDQIDMIRRWIDGGVLTNEAVKGEEIEVGDDDREHWAFRNASRPRVPPVQHQQLARSPIDHFLLAKLEAESLVYSPEADRRTLVRRVFLDLIGLPPSPDEAASFLNDPSPLAYERMIDRLLTSPCFGQRWGRHWLDAAGYVDTIGDDTDATIAKVAQGKWRYRDYVVDSFNADKPFDRFILEQIAGDEVVHWRAAQQFTPEIRELLIATTFLRSAADETLQNELNTADIRHEVLQRTMEVTVNNLLGLTIQCAKCHDHKYDPLPQEDYYRLLACFTPAFDPQAWLQPAQRELPDVSPQEQVRLTKQNAEIDEQVAERNKQLQSLRQPYRDEIFEKKLVALPEAVRADAKLAQQTPQEKRTEAQADLVEKFGGSLTVSDGEADAALNDGDRIKADTVRREINERQARRRNWGTIQAVYDVGPSPATYLLASGNHERPSYEVTAGYPRVLDLSDPDSRLSPVALDHSSGRRLALARWLTDPNKPAAALMARVIVNRTWQQLLGRGIVESADNFGTAGASPTHSELFEWLVAEFIESDWSHKHLVRLIVSSAVYRQASTPQSSDSESIDPANLLLWKMPLRQLESEIIRDSILVASGQLDRTFGGPAILTVSREDGFVVIDTTKLPKPHSKYQRSMYVLARRRYHESFLEAFGQPELTTNCTRRIPSAVVGQSLTLMNDTFLFEQSSSFANRVIAETEGDPDARRIEAAFAIALTRPPSPTEYDWAGSFLDKQAECYRQDVKTAAAASKHALRHLCHMLLCTNEFLYVP
jgi:hypothetical protein